MSGVKLISRSTRATLMMIIIIVIIIIIVMMMITIIIIIIAPICQSTWVNIDAVYENVAAQTFAQPSVPGDQSLMMI